MKWTDNSKVRRATCRSDRRERLSAWHKWFAWYPVKVGTEWQTGADMKVWLVTVMRKRVYRDSYFTDDGHLIHSFTYDKYQMNREEY
jgi:hypothetical protein